MKDSRVPNLALPRLPRVHLLVPVLDLSVAHAVHVILDLDVGPLLPLAEDLAAPFVPEELRHAELPSVPLRLEGGDHLRSVEDDVDVPGAVPALDFPAEVDVQVVQRGEDEALLE